MKVFKDFVKTINLYDLFFIELIMAKSIIDIYKFIKSSFRGLSSLFKIILLITMPFDYLWQADYFKKKLILGILNFRPS